MLPVRRASIVAVVVSAMTIFARTPAAQQGSVADVMVPAGSAVPLFTPITRTHDAPSWILTVTDNGGTHFVALFLCPPDGSRCVSASTTDR